MFLLSTQAPIITQFFILQREKGGKGQGLKMGKESSSKVNETQGFLT